AEAHDVWSQHYSYLSRDRPGLLRAILSRAEAQARRLAMVYAMLDGEHAITDYHLAAAIFLFDYCERSAAYIFGRGVGSSDSDVILRALKEHPEGLTQTKISRLFSGNAFSGTSAKSTRCTSS